MTRRKDGTYQEVLTINGKRKYFYGKTKAEVLKKIRAYEEKQDNGPLVSEAVAMWLAEKEKTVSFKTREGYNTPVQRIEHYFGNTFAKDVTPAQIQAFINGIAAQGYKRTTVQRPLDVLRMVYDFLIVQEDSVVHVNPCYGVRLPSGLKQEARDLMTREQVEIIKRSVAEPFGLFPYLIMYSGLRDGEALALRYEDFTDTHIIVDKNLSWQPNKPVIKEPKTKSGIRKVDLLQPLKNALPKKWTGYLFSADGGKTPLTNTQFRARWNQYCRSVGLAYCEIETHKSTGANNRTYERKVWHNTITPYQLRHEFATICFDAGLDPHDVKDLMGHASEEMARRVYTHILNSRREKTSKKLNDYVNNVY